MKLQGKQTNMNALAESANSFVRSHLDAKDSGLSAHGPHVAYLEYIQLLPGLAETSGRRLPGQLVVTGRSGGALMAGCRI